MGIKAQKKKLAGKKPIIAAIDFSGHSEAVLLWAYQYAKLMKLPMIALHIVHEPADEPGFYKRERNGQLTPMKEVARKMLGAFIQTCSDNHPEYPKLGKISTLLIKGLPVKRILTVAKKLDASTIVMGSKGRTGLPYLFLGSKAEEVVNKAQVPVVIVKIPNEDVGDETAEVQTGQEQEINSTDDQP